MGWQGWTKPRCSPGVNADATETCAGINTARAGSQVVGRREWSSTSSDVADWNSAGGALKHRDRLVFGNGKTVRNLFDLECRVRDRPATYLVREIDEA
jgi:hypothetical protein